MSCKHHFITLLCSLSPSLGWYVVTALIPHAHMWSWRPVEWLEVVTALIDMQGHCDVFTTGQHPRYTSNYPLISQHSVSWTPEGLLLHPRLPYAFISKAIKHVFILPYSICRANSAMQVKRLQCLRENQLMPFISLHFPQLELYRVAHAWKKGTHCCLHIQFLAHLQRLKWSDKMMLYWHIFLLMKTSAWLEQVDINLSQRLL